MVNLGINGLISGLDTNEIISALVGAERAPITRLETRRVQYSNRLQSLQNLSARLLSLRISSDRLSRQSSFAGRSVAVSDDSLVSATASSSAATGTWALRVLQLAQSQQFSGGSFASSTDELGFAGEFSVNGQSVSVAEDDTLTDIAARVNALDVGVRASVLRVATGDFRLVFNAESSGESAVDLRAVGGSGILSDLGVSTGTAGIRNSITNGAASDAFTSSSTVIADLVNVGDTSTGTFQIDEGNGNVISVDIDFAVDSLDTIASAINDAVTAFNGGGPGTPSVISAAVVENDGVFTLEITGDAPVSFVDGGGVLETLGVLAPDLAHEDQAGQNARFMLNNIEVTRESNVVSDAISGLTFTLLDDSEPTRTVQISVNEDAGVSSEVVSGFVEAYNQARGFINESTSFDTDTGVAGVLLGDSTVRGIESRLFSMLSTRVNTAASAALGTLNNGAGVDRGSIRITDRSGASADIDLSSTSTLAGVIATINRDNTIGVTASMNTAGDGIMLTDDSGGFGTLTVAEVDGTTAADFGILGNGAGNVLSGTAITTANWISASDAGLRLNTDGTLSFDQAALSRALSENPDAVNALFTQPQTGLGARFSTAIGDMTHTSRGTITFHTQAIQANITSINASIGRYEQRITRYESRLVRQFTEMERALAGFTSTSDFLATQMASLSTYQRR